ncbi:MAG TPA: hypothetical protein PKN75_14615 [Bacteroidia bacterium]|nr:hypothetical protein [Bacteroidia bacterium]HNU34818.1 hypothetical protein [Bacteroidia bacterium]
MKRRMLILLLLFSQIRLCMGQEKKATIFVFRDDNLIFPNLKAKLFIDDNLRLGLKGGWYDTLTVYPGCYDLKSNINSRKYNFCFSADSVYYFQMIFSNNNPFLLGGAEIIPVESNYAIMKINKGKLRRKSYKK